MSGLRDLGLEGLRFGTVGLWATAVYLVVAAAAKALGAAQGSANALGYGAGMCVSFFGHFLWTFRRKDGYARALRRFLAVSAAGYLLSAALMALAERIGAPFWAALGAVVTLVPLLSWLSGRYWAFR